MSKDQIKPVVSSPANLPNSHQALDLNELERVFGTPNSPKNDNRAVHIITNERRPGKDQNFLNNLDKNGSNNLKSQDVELLPSSQPLLEPEKGRQDPPLSGPEVDDLGEKPADHTPFNGIDDGLLEPEDKKPEGHEGGDGYNGVGTRFGVDDRPVSPVPGSIPDVNTYQQKKNLAQGMMDLALLSANANQLRYVIESSSAGHPYYYSSITFISLSILLQIGVGIGLIMNSRYNVKDDKDICKADKINNMTVLGIFLITIVNVFITSFSVAPTNTGIAVQQGG